MRALKNIYKLEIFAALIGILVVGMFLLPSPPTFTGYVSGLNLTIYSQNLDLMIDGSQSYTLATDKGNLNLRSFMIDGEVVGKGRVEILLDNGKGQQYLVYENVKKKPDYSGPSPITGITSGSITGNAISGGDAQADAEENQGVWLVMQPKERMNYEFTPLSESDEVVEGEFYSVCAETCNIQKDMLNSNTYELIFRIEKGAAVKISAIKYILQDE